MNLKHFVISFFLLLPFVACADKYDVKGVYQGQAAQGMAIYGDYAYILNNTGYCRVFDLKLGQIVQEYKLASYGKSNHANCASFGVEFYNNNTVPVFYVSECSSPYSRCFVENLEEGKSQLVQTIQAVENGKPKLINDWIIDNKGKYLYAFIRLGSKDTEGKIRHSIIKYRLPKLAEGKSVQLSESDIHEQFEVSFMNMSQGGAIKGRHLYLPVGLQNTVDGKRMDAERAIIIIDLKKHKIKKIIDLNNVIFDEPEDVDFYKGNLLLYCGQNGGLWNISPKNK